MKTIVIASGKGGSGKTTLTAHLAVAAGTAWIIDTDKQATLAQWHQRRQADLPERLEVAFSQLGKGLDTLAAKGAPYCFVDTAPAITEQTAAVLSLADLVMVPVRPSPADLWAIGGTMELVHRAGKPFLFVLSQAKTQANITAQAVAALSEHGRVARSFITDRVAYASAMTSGNTAPELWPKGPATSEIDALWAELKSCFAENMKTRELAYG
jgi:chromosome partitioning protein